MTPTEPTASICTLVLDPTGADHHGEATRLRQAGPVVRVILPGGVPAWAITRHDLLVDLVRDPAVSKDWRNWTAIKQGLIPDDWPLIGMLKVTNMVTADGNEHLRLRKLVSRTFTGSRVQPMRPRITEVVDDLLDDLPANVGPDGALDLRRHLAYPVPMKVICDLLGVPDGYRRRLRGRPAARTVPVHQLPEHPARTARRALRTTRPDGFVSPHSEPPHDRVPALRRGAYTFMRRHAATAWEFQQGPDGWEVFMPPEVQELPAPKRFRTHARQEAQRLADARFFALCPSSSAHAVEMGARCRQTAADLHGSDDVIDTFSIQPPTRHGFVWWQDPNGVGYGGNGAPILACHWGPYRGGGSWLAWWSDNYAVTKGYKAEAHAEGGT